MNYENKPGTGALFKNDKKSEKSPDYRGPFHEEVDGKLVEREIAAWLRKSKKGETYMQVKVSDKFVPSRKTEKAEEFSDDIPFVWAVAVPLVGLLMAGHYFV